MFWITVLRKCNKDSYNFPVQSSVLLPSVCIIFNIEFIIISLLPQFSIGSAVLLHTIFHNVYL